MQEHKKNYVDYIIIFSSLVLFIIFWQVSCILNLVNHSIVPSPARIFESFLWQVKQGLYFEHLGASCRRVLLGFLFGSFFGIFFGFLFGFVRIADDIFSAMFNILRSIPTIGLVPLFILWYGIGEKSKIIVIAISTFWSVLLNTQHGISSTDSRLLEVAAMLEKNKITVLQKIVLPSALPSIFTGIRLGLSAAWKSVVAAEMLASVRGIGYMISFAREMSQSDVLFVGLLTLGIIGLFIDVLLTVLQKKIIKWQ